jgi:hypothetical protein
MWFIKRTVASLPTVIVFRFPQKEGNLFATRVTSL